MPSPGNQSPDKPGINWLAVIRTLLIQVFVLLALAFAFVGYVNWSSDVAMEEFVAASKLAVPDPQFHSQSATPVKAVKSQIPCPPKN